MIIYLTIGLLYWALNSFVRKLEINGDWMLPIVWFLAWPIAFAAWGVLFIYKATLFILEWLSTKSISKHF